MINLNLSLKLKKKMFHHNQNNKKILTIKSKFCNKNKKYFLKNMGIVLKLNLKKFLKDLK